MRKSNVIRGVLAACTALCAASGTALAQPDVTVGELYELSNYTTGGAIGGQHAYSVGTYSCNVGNVSLTWVDGNAANLYPVISQNMYRLSNGRFEQIGQAWLKHGFCALNNVLCGSCPARSDGQPHTCDALDPGCADPYGSGLNGQQSGLGPKHEINAANATWPFPNLKGTSTGDGTKRARLLVNESDVQGQPAGTLYFVSSMYVHPEDAQFGTDNNNESYRRVTVGSNSGLTLADSTKRQQPAIFAWRDYGNGVSGGNGVADPSVQLVPVDVAGDGRFWVGCKVIDQGGGSYRYEYAVMNFNSDRGAAAFSVPVGAGTNVSNLFFRDVAYHSGELQSGTDWTPTISNGVLTWSYANNQASDLAENVLRWDTIYNFSFVANLAPVAGSVSLSLFKPGSPSVASANISVPSAGGGPIPPINDNCGSAVSIGNGATSFDSTNATTDGPDACLFSGQAGIVRDVWYTYTNGNCTDPVTIETCGSSFDTKIALYADCNSLATPIACNDDTAACAGGAGAGLGSRISFTPTANTTYLLRVGAYPTATPETGAGVITITTGTCAPQAPVNDNCANATWAAAGVTYTGSTTTATNDGTATCGTSTTSRDVWYKYRPTVSGNVDIRTCGSNYDTVLSVRTGCPGSQVTNGCNDDSATACGSGSLQSRVTVNLTAGVTYWIRVAGFQGAVGNYSLLITGGGGTVPPLNDDCSQRQGASGTTNFDTTGASTDGVTTNNCGQISSDVWFNYPSLCDGTVTLTLTGNGWTPKVAVYSGSTCTDWSSREVVCGLGSGNQTVVNFPATSGQGFTVRIGGNTASNFGSGTAVFSCTPSGPTCDSIDFNNDGGSFDPQDIDAFLSVFSEGPCIPETATCGDIDFNNDGALFDPCDIDSFLLVFSEGPCTACGV
jgi:hypothetical protein